MSNLVVPHGASTVQGVPVLGEWCLCGTMFEVEGQMVGGHPVLSRNRSPASVPWMDGSFAAGKAAVDETAHALVPGLFTPDGRFVALQGAQILPAPAAFQWLAGQVDGPDEDADDDAA